MADSRRAILHALKQQGAATIAFLAESLKLTGEAVRQQLLQLKREGWIEARAGAREAQTKTGRPATRYSLTSAGDHLFPKSYDQLTVTVIDAIAEELGEDAVTRVLARVSTDRVSALAPRLESLPLDERVDALKSLYIDNDPFMYVERVEGDYRLIERNCPFYNTAMRRPALCSVSTNTLSRLLGVRVDREERFQNSDGRCVFRVHAKEPVEASREFTLET
ncbi:MAG TPA: winged helix-turn-helix transcriptional regulator [Thermoanaerobaculia bacterium]|nr:winged helix-turn-helix transcriptional regulator [Thermoanaerobaculia bacterium]